MVNLSIRSVATALALALSRPNPEGFSGLFAVIGIAGHAPGRTFMLAAAQIVLADVPMSFDYILAVADAAREQHVSWQRLWDNSLRTRVLCKIKSEGGKGERLGNSQEL